MVALSKFFLSPIYEAISTSFSKVLPQALKFMILSAFVLWASYKRECSRRRYAALINKQSSKFIYRKKLRPSLEVTECSICLCEFEEGDEAKELHCKHAFHKNCLEKWLQLQGCHSTCPLCRSSVVPEEILFEHRQSQDEYQVLKASAEVELARILLSTMTGWGCHSRRKHNSRRSNWGLAYYYLRA